MKYFQERKFALFFAALLCLITLIPYVAGFAAQGADWRFTGFLIGVEDGNSYIAKMLSGAQGDWLFRTPYSSETQRDSWPFCLISFLENLLHLPLSMSNWWFCFSYSEFLVYLPLFLQPGILSRSFLAVTKLGNGHWLLLFLVED